MDFQLARNLSAIARAQEDLSQSLLYLDSTIDCLNREVIMSAASSEATEQLLTSARALIVQVQTLFVTQSNESVIRLHCETLKSLSFLNEESALQVRLTLMPRVLEALSLYN